MTVRQKIYKPLKMVKDLLKGKQAEGSYFHAKNLRFITHTEEATGGFVLEKGNDISFILPEVTVDYSSTSFKYTVNGKAKSLKYTLTQDSEIQKDFADQAKSAGSVFHGHSISRDGIVIFSTNNLGFDCIWYVKDEAIKDIKLVYCRNLGFSSNNPIQAHSNYENENIDKTYWIDGKAQQRSVNVKDPKLVDLKINVLNMVGDFNLSQPQITDTFVGGSHTSGMIQYAYNLYRVNGSQTKISPLSELVPLDKDVYGGGELNEVVSRTVSLKIDGLDQSYTNVKIYAVKYTSYNLSPSISVIVDQGIPSTGTLEYYDDGSVLLGISNETFLFLGGDIIIPKSMEVKNNRMFLTNYAEKVYDLVVDGIDVADGCRAFSFDENGNSKIARSMKTITDELTDYVSVVPVNEDLMTFHKSAPASPSSNHSCINVDYYKYNQNANGYPGGTGRFLKYTLTRSRVGDVDKFSEEDAKGRFYKDGEIYRLAIQFYNKYGEVTTPKWIADFVTQQLSEGNLTGYYGTLKVELLPAFTTWISSLPEEQRPVGYKILRAERKIKDRTVIAQGIINGMVALDVETKGNRPSNFTVEAENFCHKSSAIKIPSLIRPFDDSLCPLLSVKSYKNLINPNIVSGNPVLYEEKKVGDLVGNFSPLGPFLSLFANSGNKKRYYGNISEVYSGNSGDDARKFSMQFNKLMQFHCPEIEFDLISKINSKQLTVIGGLKNTDNAWWGKELNSSSKQILNETKTEGYISPSDKRAIDGSIESLSGDRRNLQDFALFGPSGNKDTYDTHHFYREYNADRKNSLGTVVGAFTFSKKNFELYGSPEIAERGQGRKRYKNNPELAYVNTMEPMSSDTFENANKPGRATDMGVPGINSVASHVCRSAFFALGADGDEMKTRRGLEDVFSQSGLTDKSSVILCEFKTEPVLLYVGSIYGGNSYEDKKRTPYVEIGSYKKITDLTCFIKSPGDTFVANYKFERISKNGTESSTASTSHVTEIVSYTTETSVDLRRRNDLSLTEWDSKFSPLYEEYKKYNRVYSQEPNLIYRVDRDYNFRAVNTFETSIIATKEKIPNEPIDSWTDLLINEQIGIDGRYGPINALISYGDEVYAFQDRAIARISILPRVQISGNDGIAVQLGTGQLFNEYKYITTKSGSVNKWGVVSTEIALYYIDALNKSFCSISGGVLTNISDSEGFHKEFQDIINQAFVNADNPIKRAGISMGHDPITSDVYISVFNEGKCTTIAYNEGTKGFTSYYDYDSPMYIFNKKEMLTVSPKNGSLVYKNFAGKHGVFYGEVKEAGYSVVLAPEPMVECLFNNLEFNCLSKDISGKESLITWDKVRLSNEFQDSGFVNLINRTNIRKKNRQHRISLPRQKNSRDRIRNNWAVMELKITNTTGISMAMNDIVLYYTPNYIVIQ
jgi:hypothetical protein